MVDILEKIICLEFNLNLEVRQVGWLAWVVKTGRTAKEIVKSVVGYVNMRKS